MASLHKPTTPILGAYIEGWRRVVHAPAVAAGVWLLTLAMAMPLGRALGSMLEAHLGSSLAADRPAWNWDADWAREFASQAQGIGRTFTHEIIGFGGSLKILSTIADNQSLEPALAGLVFAYGVVWVFLTGGIMDRLARGRATRAPGFFSACGGYFFRLLRLSVVTTFVYWALFRWLHPLLLTRVYDRLTRDITEERHGLLVRVVLYALFGLVVCLANMIFDYAKIRLVVEDRRSVIGVLGSSIRFVRRRPLKTIGLYLLNTLTFLAVLRVWLELAPQAWDTVVWAFFVTQAYLLARIWIRLTFIASEIVYFQGELAHAGYTARPEAVWPESASAEAIARLDQ